jgi:hypothetical protein
MRASGPFVKRPEKPQGLYGPSLACNQGTPHLLGCFARWRRGREAEGGGLLNRYTLKGVSRVRIPPSPPSYLRNSLYFFFNRHSEPSSPHILTHILFGSTADDIGLFEILKKCSTCGNKHGAKTASWRPCNKRDSLETILGPCQTTLTRPTITYRNGIRNASYPSPVKRNSTISISAPTPSGMQRVFCATGQHYGVGVGQNSTGVDTRQRAQGPLWARAFLGTALGDHSH